MIDDAFDKLNCIFLSLYHIENVRKTQYDSKNPDHEEKLLKVFNITQIKLFFCKLWMLDLETTKK